MMTRALTILALLTAMEVHSPASAQAPGPAAQPPPRAPPMVSAYCLPASAAFLEGDGKASEEMKKCARGDTIVIPARSAGAVARMCDFTKAIVTSGTNVVCSMVFPERASR